MEEHRLCTATEAVSSQALTAETFHLWMAWGKSILPTRSKLYSANEWHYNGAWSDDKVRLCCIGLGEHIHFGTTFKLYHQEKTCCHLSALLSKLALHQDCPRVSGQAGQELPKSSPGCQALHLEMCHPQQFCSSGKMDWITKAEGRQDADRHTCVYTCIGDPMASKLGLDHLSRPGLLIQHTGTQISFRFIWLTGIHLLASLAGGCKELQASQIVFLCQTYSPSRFPEAKLEW